MGSESENAIDHEADTSVEPPVDSLATAAKRRRRWIWFLLASVLFLVAGGFVGGVVVGWRGHDRAASIEPAPSPVVVTVTAEPSGQQQVTMPDVRGLSEKNARQVIADAGLQASVVQVSAREWAGEPGVVVEQSPVFGAESPTTVQLVLSEEAKVPDAIGKPADEVAAAASKLGAQVTMTERYEAGATPGTVLAIEPPSGEALPAVVTLTRASAPSSLFLRDVKPLEGSCTKKEVRLNGPTFDNGMLCTTRKSTEFVWLLSRGADSLVGNVGIPDTENPASTAKVEFEIDGKVVASGDAAYGKAPIVLDLDTRGALRFTIRITNTNEAVSTAVLGFGDVTLTGEAGAIQQLGGTR